MWALPHVTWADDGELGTILIDGVSYNVIRTSEDWDKFRQLVINAKGNSDVNAIMDGDFSTGNSCGDTGFPYKGTSTVTAIH